jgi:hypothetical protein
MRYAAPAVAAILLVLVPGCARAQHGSPATAVPPDQAIPISSNPTGHPPLSSNPTGHPPRGFTDNEKPSDWIVGTVTAGGTGPCYGLVTDEGVPYALHSTTGIRLDKGTRIQVQGTPAKIRINCGPGQLLEITVAEPIR